MFQLTVHMVNHLVGHAAVVLQNVVLLSTGGDGDLLGHRKQLSQVLVRNFVQLHAMVLGDHQSVALRERSDVCT